MSVRVIRVLTEVGVRIEPVAIPARVDRATPECTAKVTILLCGSWIGILQNSQSGYRLGVSCTNRVLKKQIIGLQSKVSISDWRAIYW